MKSYNSYIIERAVSKEKGEKLVKEIQENCQPYIDEMKGSVMNFYRGFYFDDNFLPDYEIYSHDYNYRKPKDTEEFIHDLINEISEEKFGWGIRNGVFVTTNDAEATRHGEPYIFIPIGHYEYAWHPKVVDLTDKLFDDWVSSLAGYMHHYHPDVFYRKNPRVFAEWKQVYKEFREKYFKKLINEYKNTDLKQADWVEVSFKCDEYFLIHPSLLE